MESFVCPDDHEKLSIFPVFYTYWTLLAVLSEELETFL